MPPAVRLQDIVDALEIQSEEASVFLDRDTGQIALVTHDLLEAAESSPATEPRLSDWQKPEWELAKRVATTDRLKPLPTQFEVHEWAIMQDFASSVVSERTRGELLHALHGAGAFRHFKNGVRQFGLEPAWFAFRAEAFQKIAREWCEANQIAWE